MTTERRLRDLHDWNYLVSMAWLFGTSETGEAIDRQNALIVSCGLPVPVYNWSFPKTPVKDAQRVIDEANTHFATKGFEHLFQVRDSLEDTFGAPLESAGFRGDVEVPCMVMAALGDSPKPPDDLEIRGANTPEDLVRMRETAFAGFELPVAAAKLFLTEALHALPTVRFYLGLVDGEPACSALLVATGPVAGIYFVATLEPFRGRGHGEAITWAAIQGGRELGCTMASLQASQLGQPVYERMGFEHAGIIRRFGAPSAAGTD